MALLGDGYKRGAGGIDVVREVIMICEGIGSAVGALFFNNLRLKVSNGSTTLFWLDM